MSTEITREAPSRRADDVPVIAPGQSLRTVTEKVSDIVLRKKSPLFWFAGLGVGFLLLQLFLLGVTRLLFVGTGIWGLNVRWPGASDHQLRLVGRHRPRRHA